MTWEIDGTDYREPPNRLPLSQAVKQKCLDCSGGEEIEAQECQVFSCPLWPHRLPQTKAKGKKGTK